MTKLLQISLFLTLVSCGRTPSNTQLQDSVDNIPPSDNPALPVSTKESSSSRDNSETPEEDKTVTCYVLVADTGVHYITLRDVMLGLRDSLRQEIDTMGRTYNQSKALIALPENHEDDIYAGDYYPRRFPSSVLSLEYLNFYQEKTLEKTIAVVTGIYETRKSADSALQILKRICPKAFLTKSDIYMGCMH